METIRIKGLEIFAYHGVNPEEKENGQKFILDIAMQADISRAAQTDDLNETVNYAAVRKTVNAVFTAQKYDLSCGAGYRRTASMTWYNSSMLIPIGMVQAQCFPAFITCIDRGA